MWSLHTILCFFTIVLCVIDSMGPLHADVLTHFFAGDRNTKTSTQTQSTGVKNEMRVKHRDVLQDYIKILLHKNATTQASLHEPTTKQQVSTDNIMMERKRQGTLERMKKLMLSSRDGHQQGGSEFVLFRKSTRISLHKTSPISNLNMQTITPNVGIKKSVSRGTEETFQTTIKTNDFIRSSTSVTTLQPAPVVSLGSSKIPSQTRTQMPTKQGSVKPLSSHQTEITIPTSELITTHPSTVRVTEKVPAIIIYKEVTQDSTLTEPTIAMSFKLTSPVLSSANTTVAQTRSTMNLISEPGITHRAISQTLMTLSSEQTTERMPPNIFPSPIPSEQTKSFGKVTPIDAVTTTKLNKEVVDLAVIESNFRKDINVQTTTSRDPSTNFSTSITERTGNSSSKLAQTTQRTPLPMHTTLKSDSDVNYPPTTTKIYTEWPSLHKKNETTHSKLTNKTKILVSDGKATVLDQLKNPNFWQELRKHNKDTKTKTNTACSEKCKVLESVCKNGGTCLNSCTGFTCVCAPGFDGYFCDKIITTNTTTSNTPVTVATKL